MKLVCKASLSRDLHYRVLYLKLYDSLLKRDMNLTMYCAAPSFSVASVGRFIGGKFGPHRSLRWSRDTSSGIGTDDWEVPPCNGAVDDCEPPCCAMISLKPHPKHTLYCPYLHITLAATTRR